MTRDEHLGRLEGEPKPVWGDDGSDAWFHFDALYEEESEEDGGERPTFRNLVRQRRGT